MGIEDSGLVEVIVEDADEDADFETCPCCGYTAWFRAVAAYREGACWVIFCAHCGKPIEKRWNIVP
jgi:hypothetical protein